MSTPSLLSPADARLVHDFLEANYELFLAHIEDTDPMPDGTSLAGLILFDLEEIANAD